MTRQDKAIWLNRFGLKWPMCRDRHLEIFWKSGQIWQNFVSGMGEIWQFGFSQSPEGAGIHPGRFVLMSGLQKPNCFFIWAIWGSVRAYSPIIWGVPPGVSDLTLPYWPLLAPLAARESFPENVEHFSMIKVELLLMFESESNRFLQEL